MELNKASIESWSLDLHRITHEIHGTDHINAWTDEQIDVIVESLSTARNAIAIIAAENMARTGHTIETYPDHSNNP